MREGLALGEAFPKAGSTRDDVGDCTRARGVQRSACAVAKKNNQQTEGTGELPNLFTSETNVRACEGGAEGMSRHVASMSLTLRD